MAITALNSSRRREGVMLCRNRADSRAMRSVSSVYLVLGLNRLSPRVAIARMRAALSACRAASCLASSRGVFPLTLVSSIVTSIASLAILSSVERVGSAIVKLRLSRHVRGFHS